MTKIFKVIALVLALTSALSWADGFNHSGESGFRYGPNMSWRLFANTPFVWGAWLPQSYAALNYTWLEPIDTLAYGEKLGRKSSFLRLDASVEVTPFYGGYRLGLGVKPFKTNPYIEMNFTYESYLFFKSNLEMVTADVENGGKIAETWNADYIVDNIWGDDAEFDYAQLFDISTEIGYAFQHGAVLGVAMHYILSDVSTNFDGKSYDYKRNIPIFSRDFLIQLDLFGRKPITDMVAFVFESNYYRTGYLRSKNTVQKEALSYVKTMAGAHLSWNDGLRNLLIEVGGWNRLKKRFDKGGVSQQLLFQIQYDGFFTFPLKKNYVQ